MAETDNRTFEQRLRQQLRDAEGRLDARTRARLAAARRDALAQEPRRLQGNRLTGGWFGRPVAGGLGALATIAVVAVLASRVWQPATDMPANAVTTVATDTAPPGVPVTPRAPAGERSRLATNDDEVTPANSTDIELYENLELLEFYEDLEFYEWLVEMELEEMPS